MTAARRPRVLAVCLGNICRSPAAEAAIREAADNAGLAIEVDSAGTGDWHVGGPPNPRMVAAGARAGLPIEGRARQVVASDLDDFDLVVAMDADNLADLQRLAGRHDATAHLRLFRSFDPAAAATDVPDPYYGQDRDFDDVVAMVRPAAAGLVAWLQEQASTPES